MPKQIVDPKCPLSRTLHVIADEWSLLIIRDLLRGTSKRFNDFINSLNGISPNVLSSRLKQLEENGIIKRRLYSEHPPRAEYYLTEKGLALGPVLEAMKAWGDQHTEAQ